MSARGHQVNAGVPSVSPVSGIPEAGEQKKSKQSDSLLELLDPDGQTLPCQGVMPGWIIVGNTLQLVQKNNQCELCFSLLGLWGPSTHASCQVMPGWNYRKSSGATINPYLCARLGWIITKSQCSVCQSWKLDSSDSSVHFAAHSSFSRGSMFIKLGYSKS